MKKLQILLLLLLLNAVVIAKVPGYQGKRFILKTDLASLVDLGGSVSMEIAIARHMTIEPEYRFYNKTVKFTLVNEQENTYSPTKTKQKAHIVEHAVFLGVKFFPSKSKTAPKGFYTFFKFGLGRANITSKGYDTEYIQNPDFPTEYIPTQVIKDYKLNNVRTLHIVGGVGVNYIFAKRVVADIAWGIQYSSMNAKEYKNNLDGYTNKFGPNVVTFIPPAEKKQDQLRFGLGFMFKASIGILLF